jgi:hypothetical protein
MEGIQIYPAGTKVVTEIGRIECIIQAACIRSGSISYEVGYFHDGQYLECWLKEFEFTVHGSAKRQPVGFKV